MIDNHFLIHILKTKSMFKIIFILLSPLVVLKFYNNKIFKNYFMPVLFFIFDIFDKYVRIKYQCNK